MRVDDDMQEHPESLLDGAIRGGLSLEDRATLERHLATCTECATELAGARLFRASIAPGKQDEALNQVAVEMALSRLQDEALDRAAVEKALVRLRHHEAFGERLRRWLGLPRWRRPVAGLALLAAAAATVVMGLALHQARQPRPRPVAQVAPLRTLLLDDGSEVAPIDGTTAIQVTEQTPVLTTVRLRTGGAQFRVRHDSRRVFRVDAGPLEIEDLGTVFRVEHQAEGKIHVAVSEGRVAVVYPATRWRVVLGAGEDHVFSSTPEPSETTEQAKEAPRARIPAVAATVPRVQGHLRSTDDPADLLLAADVARRAGHPQAAVAPLRRLVESYPKDPRTPSAAFTLGWVLLTDLGRAREAAVAFAEAERIAPRGALAEDAAARVPEAWQKAGDSRRAAQAARHYEQLYPTGRYLTLMRGLVGDQ